MNAHILSFHSPPIHLQHLYNTTRKVAVTGNKLQGVGLLIGHGQKNRNTTAGRVTQDTLVAVPLTPHLLASLLRRREGQWVGPKEPGSSTGERATRSGSYRATRVGHSSCETFQAVHFAQGAFSPQYSVILGRGHTKIILWTELQVTQ